MSALQLMEYKRLESQTPKAFQTHFSLHFGGKAKD